MSLESHRQSIRKILSSEISNETSLEKIKEYKNLALSLNDKLHAAYADFYTAKVYEGMGEKLKAFTLIKNNLPLFIKEDKKDFLHASYLALGHIKYFQGKTEDALSFYIEATKIKTNLKQNKAVSFNSMTGILINLKQYDKAIANIKAGLNELSLKDFEDRPLYFLLLLNLSNVLLLKKMPEKSLEILTKISKAQKKHPQFNIKSKLDRNYGNYYKFLKEDEKALEFYNKALINSTKDQNAPIKLEISVAISEIYINQNRLNEAEVILISSHKNYKNEDSIKYRELLEVLISLYEITGEKEKQEKYIDELNLLV